jgi:hypothetical protein
MDGDTQLARRYRQRASQVRSIAAAIEDKEQSKILHQVADDYDQMARAFEEHAAAEPRPSPQGGRSRRAQSGNGPQS